MGTCMFSNDMQVSLTLSSFDACRVPSGHAPTPPTVILDRPGDQEEEEEEEEEAGQFVVEDSAPLAPPTIDSLLVGGEDSGDKPEG